MDEAIETRRRSCFSCLQVAEHLKKMQTTTTDKARQFMGEAAYRFRQPSARQNVFDYNGRTHETATSLCYGKSHSH